MKNVFKLFLVLMLVSMLLVACKPTATEAPA